MVKLRIFFLKKKDIYIFYLFLKRGERRERERERNIYVQLPLVYPLLGAWPTTQACALTGNETSDTLVHSLALNPLSHTGQGKLRILRLDNYPGLSSEFNAITNFFIKWKQEIQFQKEHFEDVTCGMEKLANI